MSHILFYFISSCLRFLCAFNLASMLAARACCFPANSTKMSFFLLLNSTNITYFFLSFLSFFLFSCGRRMKSASLCTTFSCCFAKRPRGDKYHETFVSSFAVRLICRICLCSRYARFAVLLGRFVRLSLFELCFPFQFVLEVKTHCGALSFIVFICFSVVPSVGCFINARVACIWYETYLKFYI